MDLTCCDALVPCIVAVGGTIASLVAVIKLLIKQNQHDKIIKKLENGNKTRGHKGIRAKRLC